MAEQSQVFVRYQSEGSQWKFEHLTALTGSAGNYSNPFAAAIDSTMRCNYVFERPPDALAATIREQFEFAQQSKDDYLSGTVPDAIRAARRAIAANPNDGRAYLALGRAYYLLFLHSRERVWSLSGFRKVAELRQAQATLALKRAIDLNPSLALEANQLLADMYAAIAFHDLEVEHRRAAGAAALRSGNKPAVEAFRKQLDQLTPKLTELESEYEKQASGVRVSDRARVAHQLGLSGRALKVLMGSDLAAFGDVGIKLQLDLMIRAGLSDQVLDWTSEEMRSAVGTKTYHWYRSLAMAAVGGYAAADEELTQIAGGPDSVKPNPQLLGDTVILAVSQQCLAAAPKAGGMSDAVAYLFAQADALKGIESAEVRLRNLSEVSVLRAILAIEVGDFDRAWSLLEDTLFFSPERSGRVEDPIREIAKDLLVRLELMRRR
jgi:tetratricopeptide (TPR) repeat protein